MTLEESIGKLLTEKNLTIATVESCTGGLLSSKLTDVSGSSNYVKLNLVTYSNEAKRKMLGVPKHIIEVFGAVSEECAYDMAKGLYKLTKADICVSTTGIAGPTGGSIDKPVGLMYSCIYSLKDSEVYRISLDPSIPRIEMKERFTNKVLKNILEFIWRI